MPGSRRDRKPKRASPKVAIHRRLAEPKTNRGSIRPRRPVGFVGSLCLGRHPKSRVHQPVLKHGPKKQRGVNAPRLASMNSSSPKQIQLLWQAGNPAPRLFQWSPQGRAEGSLGRSPPKADGGLGTSYQIEPRPEGPRRISSMSAPRLGLQGFLAQRYLGLRFVRRCAANSLLTDPGFAFLVAVGSVDDRRIAAGLFHLLQRPVKLFLVGFTQRAVVS